MLPLDFRFRGSISCLVLLVSRKMMLSNYILHKMFSRVSNLEQPLTCATVHSDENCLAPYQLTRKVNEYYQNVLMNQNEVRKHCPRQ